MRWGVQKLREVRGGSAVVFEISVGHSWLGPSKMSGSSLFHTCAAAGLEGHSDDGLAREPSA